MKALLIDDHPIARRGLGDLLKDALPIQRIVEVDDGTQIVEAARRTVPDLVFLDLRMPGGHHPSAVCAQLRTVVPRACIVLVTAFADDAAEIKRCLAAGADGCLLKDSSAVDLTAALRRLASGEKVIDPRVAQQLATEMVEVLRGDRPARRLTAREREVLTLLAEGCSNRMIAERLALAETTIKGYVGSLLDKLGAASRLQAVVRASQDGLL